MLQHDPNESRRPSLGIICPVFNEQQAIPLFFKELSKVLSRVEATVSPSLYFVDNGSNDSSLEIIRELHRLHPNVFVIVLSRNFGYQNALETALRIVETDLYVMIDVDCEDPPDMIDNFLRVHAQGFDIVYGERIDRTENRFMKALRRLFYRSVRLVADEHFVLDMAEFCLLTSEVRDAILQDSTSFPFLRASIGRIGFNRKGIPYKRHARIAGKTHYNFAGMTVFAVAGILSASTVALRIAAYIFPFWATAMIGLAISACLWQHNWQIPALLVTGFVFIGFSVVATGLYVARIYKNGLRRPNAIVRHSLCILPQTARRVGDVTG
jgi:glycosyltransferase involved in cell wall biosynthesis